MDPVPEAGALLDQPFEWIPGNAVRHKILVDTRRGHTAFEPTLPVVAVADQPSPSR